MKDKFVVLCLELVLFFLCQVNVIYRNTRSSHFPNVKHHMKKQSGTMHTGRTRFFFRFINCQES
ncbi:unnamed protein product [Ixodes pacificus]